MRRHGQRGVTLIEMMIVVSLIGLVAGISFPSVTSGLDSIRLTSASDGIVTFLNSGLNRAERRQQLMEVVVSKPENALILRSEDPNFVRRLAMPEGVTIVRVLPENLNAPEEAVRSIVLYPGGSVPGFGIEIANRRGVHRIVRVDPITGIPRVENVAPPS